MNVVRDSCWLLLVTWWKCCLWLLQIWDFYVYSIY